MKHILKIDCENRKKALEVKKFLEWNGLSVYLVSPKKKRGTK